MSLGDRFSVFLLSVSIVSYNLNRLHFRGTSRGLKTSYNNKALCASLRSVHRHVADYDLLYFM